MSTSTTQTLQATFDSLADMARDRMQPDEGFAVWFSAEDSSFVRFNHGRIRQPGDVVQRTLTVDLRRGRTHASGTIPISGDRSLDDERLGRLLVSLRESLPMLPEDPYLLVPDEVRSTTNVGEDRLPDPHEATRAIIEHAEGLDLVGILAAGGVHAGYADSRGQRNWFTSHSFHFDFSAYHRADKAVKGAYAGFTWDDEALRKKLDGARESLELLKRPAARIEPGRYRVYLTPAALFEVFDLLGYGAFGLKSLRTKQSPLLKLEQGTSLSPKVTLVENTAEGVGPAFNASGFLRPPVVELVREGRFGQALVSPRSAQEYGVAGNGADDDEAPAALQMAGGDLDEGRVLEALGDGVLVSNLWYLNYSDRPAGRMTGMTRFATFLVEGGRVKAPLEVMRFDESLYRMLGEKLEGLSREREMIFDPHSYGARSTRSALLPGALVRDFHFSL